ncbi:MAG: cohesin domain-containing protein [bacterium]
MKSISLLGIFLLLLYSGVGLSQAASVAVCDGSGFPGAQNIEVPLELTIEKGEHVAAIQLDISYDPNLLTFKEVAAGQAALDSKKQVTGSTPSEGTIRTIIYGLNQNSLEDGIIATISFDIKSSASAGVIPLSASNATASDPDANFLSLNTAAGSITITDAKGKEKKSWPTKTHKRLPICFIALLY